MPREQLVQAEAMLVVILTAVFLWNSLNGFDGTWFHVWVLVWGFSMLLLTVLMTGFHAKSIWTRLEKLLEWLETTTMREAFQDIGVSGLLSIKIWHLVKFRRSYKILDQTVDKICSIYGSDSAVAAAAKGELGIFVAASAQGRQVSAREIDSLNEILNVGVGEAVAGSPSNSTRSQSELRLYLALRFIAFVRYAMLHIGTLITFSAYGFVAAVVSIMLYAFEGRKTLGYLAMLAFITMLIWIGRMMVQFERNGMLSRLEGSTPGETSYWQVAFHLLTVGGLPLLAIVVSQFPAFGNFVFTLFGPLLGAIH
jgi:hypothetical protein